MIIDKKAILQTGKDTRCRARRDLDLRAVKLLTIRPMLSQLELPTGRMFSSDTQMHAASYPAVPLIESPSTTWLINVLKSHRLQAKIFD